jgi:phosphonate transport system substrate-binding protein
MMKRRVVASLIVFTSLLVLITFTIQLSAADKPASPAADPITILTPYADAAQAEQMAKLLANESGLAVRAAVPGCAGAAVEMLGLGQGDIAFLAAISYVESHDKYGADVKLVAERFGYTWYAGQIMVRTDGGYNSVNDLAGVNVAFPSEQSISGYYLPIFHLSRTHGIDANTFFNQMIAAGSHTAAARAVYDAEFQSTPIQAGFAYADVRSALVQDLPDIYTEVQVLEQTVGLPNDTVTVRPDMDPALATQLTNAMTSVMASPQGEALIGEIYGIDDLKPANDASYDITREFAAFWNFESGTCSEYALITPQQGGSMTHVDDAGRKITLHIPPDAMTDTLQLSLTSLPLATHMPDNFISTGPVINLTAVISGTTDLVTTLDAPYSLSADYDDDQLDLPAEKTVAWYFWDGSAWVYEPTSKVDPVNNIVTAEPGHFSQWAIFADPQQVYLPLIIGTS